ncbi:hypothetical protein CDL15_Pgr022379 [Punica granatum]|uniref:Uncharacterized protein n=1 Tax=Punica granatum TaxID=22663 RepID=A0A218VS26_PUNGR|nr:hypothetical protein CDL15_Pgr022379 [Punica granatum]
MVARGTTEVARELTLQESKLARVTRPAKVARGTSEVAWRTCGAGKYARTGLQIRQGCKRQEEGGSASLCCKKVNSPGLADPAWLQEARARWLGELAVQESKLARIRQGCKRHEGGGSANLGCKKVNSHGLADPATLQEARARWLGELAVQESKLIRIRQGGKRHEGGGSANLRCEKVNSHGLADPARLQEARAWWLGELAVQESKLARVSRLGKVARGTSELAHGLADPARPSNVATGMSEVARQHAVEEIKLTRIRQGCKRQEGGGSANLRCKKVNSPGLEDPERLQEARARWLGELAVQESKLARVSRPGKVARGKSELARRTCAVGK